MGEVLEGHEVVGLNGLLNVLTVNTHRHTHDHLLWSLRNLSVDAEQVGPLKSLETEVLVLEVTVVDDSGVELLGVLRDYFECLLGDHRRVFPVLGVDIVVEVGNDSRELLLGLLVKVRHGDTGSEDGVVGMRDGHVGYTISVTLQSRWQLV